MRAAIGDQLHVHSRTVEDTDRTGLILEVRGASGEPPYLVRFDDGRERLVFPGGDCVVEPRRSQEA